MLPCSAAAAEESAGPVATMTTAFPGGMGGNVSVHAASLASRGSGGRVLVVTRLGGEDPAEGRSEEWSRSGFMGVSLRNGKVRALSHKRLPDQEVPMARDW